MISRVFCLQNAKKQEEEELEEHALQEQALEEQAGEESEDPNEDPVATGQEENSVAEENFEVLPLNLEGLIKTETLHSSFIKTPEDLKDRIKLLLETNKV